LSRTRAALLAFFGVAVAALCTFAVIPATQAQALSGPPAAAQPPTPQGAPPQGAPQQAAPAAVRPPPPPVVNPVSQSAAGRIAAIKVEGNARIEETTIKSYMLVRDGDPFDADQIDRSLKTLYATGLFSDVQLNRQGDTLVVHVVENPIVNRIAFEGNHKLNDETLRAELQLRPRAVFTPTLAQSDRQRLLDLYAKRGYFAATIEPKTIKLDQNRVDVVFEINDGANTLVSRIAFVGNHAYSEGTLRDVITSREEAWWRFLSSSDNYDPERVNFDKEQLRRYYFQHGYADFQVVSATAELAPDKSAFFITFTLNEGARYRISKVTVNVTLRGVTEDMVLPQIELEAGDWYDGDAAERSVQAISKELQSRGFPFVEVRPEVKRNTETHEIELLFNVGEGPRVFVERIDIIGNQRTKDKVIRREYRLAEGDPMNAELVRRSRQRLQDTDYFSSIEIASSAGSAADRVILTNNIQEKATGELSIGGGYSTDIGALATIGLRERNLVGTGIDGGVNLTIAQRQSQANISFTDPYFLDRNITVGFDIFATQTTNLQAAQYREQRFGFDVHAGYEFSEHLRQLWTYTLVDRHVYDVEQGASIYIQDQTGWTLLSQIGQTLTLDYRDSRLDPHTGYIIRGGLDFAGIGGDVHYIRSKLDATYYLPLDTWSGNTDWGMAFSAGIGRLYPFDGEEEIIDRFFLGGDNLRGFQTGGAGPHATYGGSSLGGRTIWTQSSELHFPLPINKDLGLTGRAFVDVGSAFGIGALSQQVITANNLTPQQTNTVDYQGARVGAGLGVSWKTPFGLINIDVGVPVKKYHYDQTQLLRFGFGTRF
jgi:outer membrane protein insertion porin family